ncbi:MAG: exopolysaccharide Pel transporter PelG [Elusimicrobia bacterium]|nr:exopolysaccharide Pel transporter PelG [Elusimicrobiota bacterium]
MAGIGFRLQKLLSGEDYTSAVKAFGFSTLITAGPFLITIILVLFIQAVSRLTLTDRGMAYLQSLITYGYAFSLVTVGPSFLVLTRYVADEYYRGHVTSFSAAFFSAYTINLAVWGPLVFWYFSGISAGWDVRLGAFLLYAMATGMWLAMVFLSAAQDWWAVSRAFLWGLAASLVGAWVLGEARGMPGYFLGFVLGQAVVLGSLINTLIREFGYWEPRDHNWVRYFRLYPKLAGIGFFYNLGIWADKFIFWASKEGDWLDARLRYCPIYDSPMFFAYISILPAFVYFFLLIETDFFFKYHDYYSAIQEQESLATLERRRDDIVRSLRHNLKRVLLAQGLVSVVALLLCPWFVEVSKMNPLQMSILRLGIFGAFLQGGALIVQNILLYFDHQDEALKVSGLFCISNIVLTAVTLKIGLPAYGYGYALSALLTVALGMYYLNERLRLLHFWTFNRQPFPDPVVVADDAESDII